MSWVCERCSTANADSYENCFVCGAEKPVSVRRDARRRRTERFLTGFVKVFGIILKVLFCLALLLSVAGISYNLTYFIKSCIQGVDAGQIFLNIGIRALNNFIDPFRYDFLYIFKHFGNEISGFFVRLAEAFKHFWENFLLYTENTLAVIKGIISRFTAGFKH